MNRAEFQHLANERIADAKSLLAARRWGAAYYLSGYAVECALKSCILARLEKEVELVFEDRRFSEKCWTHNLPQLLELAGLKSPLASDAAVDFDLLRYWDTVKDWNELSRYARKTKAEAEELFEAITDRKHGVLSWLRKRW